MADEVSRIAVEASARTHDPRTQRLLVALGALVSVAAVVLFLLWLGEHQRTTDLDRQVAGLQGTVDTVAGQQRQAASSAQQLADQVTSLGKTPVVTPPAPISGPTGPAGRGVAGTDIRNGHLVVTFTDGTTADVGIVSGPAGAPGVSISTSMLTGGHLVIVYSDGHTTDVGEVTGPAGAAGRDGAAGAAGRSVVSVTNTGGHLIVGYSDGTSSDAGPLPAGPPGPAGPAGAQGSTGAAGVAGLAGRPPASFTIQDDPFTYTCTPDTPPDPGASPTYSCTRSKP